MKKYRTINLGGEFELDLYPLKSPSLKPVLVTAEGVEIEKVEVKKSNKAVYKYLAKEKEIGENEICYKIGNRIIHGKPRFTQFIKSYVEVEKELMRDKVIASEYFLACPDLVKKLKKKDKMITFAFSFGNGFAFYQAFIYLIADEYLVMSLAYPNMDRTKTLFAMSEGLVKGKGKEIQDNDLVADLIAEQTKLMGVCSE